jgi:WD40 repeat protein
MPGQSVGGQGMPLFKQIVGYLFKEKIMKTKLFAIVCLVIVFISQEANAALELLVTSRNTNNVLRYDGVTGTFIDEFVTSGSGGLSAPGGIAFRQDGYIYVTSLNTGQASVKRYNAKTGAFVDNFTSERPSFPYAGLIFGPEGNLYTATETYENVYRYNGQTGAFIDEFLSGGNNMATVGLAFGPDDNLYVSNIFNKSIDRYDGNTGVFIDEFVSSDDTLTIYPIGLVFGPDGNLYASGNSGVYRFNGSTGTFIDEFVTSGSGGLGLPINLTFGPDNNLYVCNFNDHEILRYNGQTGDFIDVFASGGGLDRAADLVFIPEPASLSLLLAGCIALLKRC